MRYLALIGDHEVEFADERGVEEAFGRGEITPETWIKVEDVESDWEIVAEMFPHLCGGRDNP